MRSVRTYNDQLVASLVGSLTQLGTVTTAYFDPKNAVR